MWSPLLDCNSACGRKRCTAVNQRPDEIVELLGRHRPVDAAAAFGQVGAEVVRRNAVGDTYPSTDLTDRRRVGTRTRLPGAKVAQAPPSPGIGPIRCCCARRGSVP